MASLYLTTNGAFEIRDSPLHGRGLFAVRDIAPGEVVLVEGAAWIIHQKEALSCYPFFRRFQEASDSLVRTFIRGPADPQEQDDSMKARFANILTLHGGFQSLAEAEKTWDTDSKAFVKRLSDIFIANAIAKTGRGPAETENVRYCAIFTISARLNHSCAPNVDVSVRNTHEGSECISTRVIANRNIRKDEEFTRSYVSLLLPTQARKEYLAAQWDFICRCQLCAMRPHEIAATDGRHARLVKAREVLESGAEKMLKEKPVGMDDNRWKQARLDAVDRMLGPEGIQVIEEMAEKEPHLSGWYLFDRYGQGGSLEATQPADDDLCSVSVLPAGLPIARKISTWS